MGIFDEIRNPKAKPLPNPETFEEIVSVAQKEIDAAVAADMQDYHTFLEMMCEKSLVDPEGRGVHVVEYWDGYDAHLCERVPWANLHIQEVAGLIDEDEDD